MTKNREFSCKISIFRNFGPLAAVHDITSVEKLSIVLKPISKGNFWLLLDVKIQISFLSRSIHSVHSTLLQVPNYNQL